MRDLKTTRAHSGPAAATWLLAAAERPEGRPVLSRGHLSLLCVRTYSLEAFSPPGAVFVSAARLRRTRFGSCSPTPQPDTRRPARPSPAAAATSLS